MQKKLFTSESVTEGHPDKLCDRISDAVLDAVLAQDPDGRVACETLVTTGLVSVVGEITTSAQIDIPAIAREVIREVGYTAAGEGFDADSCAVVTALDRQSADIALGVDRSAEEKAGSADAMDLMGAGDQGMMFGFACRETPELMPLPISLAHRLCRRLTELRKTGVLPYLRPDGKAQVTVEYRDGRPARIEAVVVSAQHTDAVALETLRADLNRELILPVLPAAMLDADTRFYINPTGRFIIGGPHGDSGLTGRKIIVDTYGGYARHGGGAFSGKDPSKVDRSAAYAARWAAKNLVAAGLAEKCELQLAYAIGVARPVSLTVDSFGTGAVSDERLAQAVLQVFDLRPAAIVRELALRQPLYRSLSAYGHMGREELDVPWERCSRTEALRRAVYDL